MQWKAKDKMHLEVERGLDVSLGGTGKFIVLYVECSCKLLGPCTMSYSSDGLVSIDVKEILDRTFLSIVYLTQMTPCLVT